jgi:transcriptional regulator with XRE-family HTH domain
MAARRVERKNPMPKTQAERFERALRRLVGQNILAARQAADLSQQQLGDLADLSPNYLGQAERGSANVTLDVLARLAACLGCRPADLLTEGH